MFPRPDYLAYIKIIEAALDYDFVVMYPSAYETWGDEVKFCFLSRNLFPYKFYFVDKPIFKWALTNHVLSSSAKLSVPDQIKQVGGADRIKLYQEDYATFFILHPRNYVIIFKTNTPDADPDQSNTNEVPIF